MREAAEGAVLAEVQLQRVVEAEEAAAEDVTGSGSVHLSCRVRYQPM